MKVYLAGPMSGIPEFNFPAFNAVEAKLIDLGYGVINPARLEAPVRREEGDYATGTSAGHLSKAAYLKRDFQHLSHCDGIVLLPGWARSPGANCELWAARMMGLLVFEWDPATEKPWAAPFLTPLLGPVREHVSGVMQESYRVEFNKVMDFLDGKALR